MRPRRTPVVDVAFDVRADSGGRDADTYSPTLARYHRLLWSKPLPNGATFELTEVGTLLHHASALGEFLLASDAIVPLFNTVRMAPILDRIPPRRYNAVALLGSTIGGRLVFPSTRHEGKITINGARGFHPRISDRFDLTLECIRRHYAGQTSPIADALARYSDFFALFDDFRGYTSFFLLDDLVDTAGAVRFFLPFADFTTPAIPATVADYTDYLRKNVVFVAARNKRISAYVNGHLMSE